MTTHDNMAVAAGHGVGPARWREQFDDLMGRIAGRFARVEPRRRARAFVLGLLSGDQIPLTRNEIATPSSTLVIEPVNDTTHRRRWSAWRRRHQRRAKTCHYQRQARQP